ncbi:MAG: serine O-acetyltransferase [Planctomycetaceae bacterium]|nr:serine O-acetyltransferase [Planctomycetaceae bacterium]
MIDGGQHLSMAANSADDTAQKLWVQIRSEVSKEASAEPILASFLHATILNHERLEAALSFHLASKLCTPTLSPMLVRELIDEAFTREPSLLDSVCADLEAVRVRDPASHGYATPFLYFKGFHALQSYRVAHWLWQHERCGLAVYFQNRISEVFGVDCHPAAKIGAGILIDHATSVVIGETAVIEDNVSLLHEVTLGGTGKELGDRHPKVRKGVLIGAGAKILGNIEIGEGAKVGAGSVVLDSVPPHTTVAGVPAVRVGRAEVESPALEMDQQFPHSHSHESGSGI